MNSRVAFSPLLLLFGVCPLWKAFATPYALPGFSNSLLQIAVPLLAVAAWGVLRPERPSRGLIWATGCVGTAATLAIAAVRPGDSGLDGLPAAVGAGATVALFAAYALFFLLWTQMYVRLDVARAGAAIGGSYVLSSAGYFGLSPIGPEVCLGIAACLPLMSAGALVGCLDGNAGGTVPAHERYRNLKALFSSRLFPWRIVVAICACSLAAGMSRAHTSTPEDLFAVGLAGTLCVAFILFPHLRAVGIYEACRLLFTAMTLCLLFGLVMGESALAHLLVGIAQTLSSIVLVLLLCDSSHRFGLPVLPVVGIARACTSAAFLAGGMLSRATFGTFGDTGFVAAAVYGGAAAVIVVASLWWLAAGPADDGRDESAPEEKNTLSPKSTAQPPEGTQVGTGQIPQALESLIKARASTLGDTYGLSKRETEVLALLAWGKSTRRVEEELVLSPNTVKTHVKHIYAKLGIHSRAELDALLFDAESDDIGDGRLLEG